jgi:hypothetical protein
MSLSVGQRARRLARTVRMLVMGRSDTDWWGDANNLHVGWAGRSEAMARMLPAGSVVLEFGAGDQSLKRHLPEGSRYLPSDLVQRTQETIVCDLNLRPLPDFSSLGATTTVLSGVLEYVHRVDEVALWLATVAPMCLVSYCPAKVRFAGERALRLAVRAENGWVSALTSDELVASFKRAGFDGGAVDRWRGHQIYRFERRKESVRPLP